MSAVTGGLETGGNETGGHETGGPAPAPAPPPTPAATRRAGVVVLALVFAAGVATGAAGLLAGVVRTLRTHPERLVARLPLGTDAVLDRLDRRLDLTPAQRAALGPALARRRASAAVVWRATRPAYAALLDSARADVEAQLTAGQRARFARLVAERAALLPAVERGVLDAAPAPSATPDPARP